MAGPGGLSDEAMRKIAREARKNVRYVSPQIVGLADQIKKAVFGSSPIFQLSLRNALPPNLIDLNKLFGTTRVSVLQNIAPLAVNPPIDFRVLPQTQVASIQQAIAEMMPDISQHMSSVVSKSFTPDGASVLGAYTVPKVQIGLTDAINTNAMLPIGDLQKVLSEMVASDATKKALQELTSSISTQMMANSGIEVGISRAMADSMVVPGLAEALGRILPDISMPTIPGLRALGKLDISFDQLRFVEDVLEADPGKLRAFKDATASVMAKLKVSRKTAEKTVLILVWLTWFCGLMAVLRTDNETAVWVSQVLSASGLANADNISKIVVKKIFKEEPDED